MARTRIHHFEGFSIKRAGIDIKLDMSRIEGNFNDAQKELDSMVMASMIPFMPMQDGKFIDKTKLESASVAGSGKVYAAVGPEGRFLYGGKTMVDMKTGSPWARKDTKKVLVSQFGGKTKARPNLKYSKNKHPQAQSHWFDAAKKKNGDNWVQTVKKIAGGGK